MRSFRDATPPASPIHGRGHCERNTVNLSIVMPYYRRASLLANTLWTFYEQSPTTDFELVIVNDDVPEQALNEIVSDAMLPVTCGDVRIINTKRDYEGRGPAFPINVGVREARGEYVILQSPECAHVGPVIDTMVQRLERRSKPYLCMRCVALPERCTTVPAEPSAVPSDATEYAGPSRRVVYPFCAGFRRQTFIDIGGIDEQFTHLGYEDDWLAWLVYETGFQVKLLCLRDCCVVHQWHPLSTQAHYPAMKALYMKLISEVENDGKSAVSNRENPSWGRLVPERANA